MGTAHWDELTVVPEVCAPVGVDTGELRAAAGILEALVQRLREYQHLLSRVDQVLLEAHHVPGGGLSAAPARHLLGIQYARLGSLTHTVEGLAATLAKVAAAYAAAEGRSHGFFTRLGTVASGWRGLYGTWLPTPAQMIGMPLGRYYQALTRRSLQELTAEPLGTLSSPRHRLAAMFSGGAISYHQILTMSPTGWISRGPHLGTALLLAPTAFSPLLFPASAGLDREEGARFARSLAGSVLPHGGVDDAALLFASGIDGLHDVLGHRSVQVDQLPARAGDGEEGRRPKRTFEGMLSVMGELTETGGADLGEIRIDRVTSASGDHSWQVYLPGGQGIDPRNIHSLLHAPSAVASRPTTSMEMVVSAMRMAKIEKGEPVVIIGHSHGGITASMTANNARVRAEFDIPVVIAAGSPVDRHEIRPDTHVISFEHTEDFVPGLDGIARQDKPGMTRVERTLADSADPYDNGTLRSPEHTSDVHRTHDHAGYRRTAALADDHPGLAHTRAHLEALIPEGTVTTYRFRGRLAG